MADAAVESLLGNIHNLLSYHANLIIGAHDEVKQLESDLRLFKAFLIDSTSKKRTIKDGPLSELVRQIRDVVYKAEDVIDSFVTQATDINSKKYFLRESMTPVSLHDVARQIKSIIEQINQFRGGSGRLDELATLDIKVGTCTDHEKQEVHEVRQVNVVGIGDEVEKLSRYLRKKTQHLDVISIIGAPGLGKTTLARKIYNDPSIMYQLYGYRIWVHVSQEFNAKDVFLDILKSLIMTPSEEMYRKTDLELAGIIRGYLGREAFLIVMDDVRVRADWEKLKIALPMTNNKGKVLITSRNEDVARYAIRTEQGGRHANRDRIPHRLCFFTPEQSWLLFRLEVFGKPECPSELETLGKTLAKRCGGLPLAIAVIGGILAKENYETEDLSSVKNTWTKVSNRVDGYFQEKNTPKSMEKIIALSYNKLPNHLRACFLYLGMFPEDYEIPVWKLIRMWIAEGFIQHKDGISLEETAESYVHDLVDRNLLRTDKMRRNGKVKTCRIHDMLRDFCIKEGGKERENFLQEIKMSSQGIPGYLDTRLINSRRLCIHSNVLSFASSKPFGPHVRSFVCFSKEEDIPLPAEHMAAMATAFKLLRVLDVKPIRFSKLPSEMYQLLHLKYIHLSTTLTSLPKAFTRLWNIQTLIVDTTSRTLEIKADIWKMVHLTHLHTNATTILPKPTSSSNEAGKLETLGTISSKSCTREVFARACNLKKLGIHGKLATLVDGKREGSFGNLQGLKNLEKLKLLNEVSLDQYCKNKLDRLPLPDLFPPKLKKLTISHTYLDWSQMSILGMLKCLEVLKLKHNALVGEYWETENGGFCHLEVLQISTTNLTFWKASAHHFPRLRRLELKYCLQLQEIPIELADIPTLQVLELFRSNAAAFSAESIKAKRNEIELSIFRYKYDYDF